MYRFKSNSLFLFSSLVYAAAATLVFPFLAGYVDNPDTVSYITIAHKYQHHDFANAINGYWSPLLSWMLALLFNLSHNDIFVFKVLQLMIGWFALYNFGKLTQSIVHTRILQIVLSFAVIPFLISYALLNLTPDLLFLFVILLYLRIVSEKEFYNHKHFGLIAGVLGVLLYFSKSFGLCFFLIHFSFLVLKNLLLTREYAFKLHILKNYFQAIVCFVLISSIWIYLISDKYNHFTISETAVFNLSKEVAAGPEEENKLPVLTEGLKRPVNNTAVNAWEDPGLATQITPLHPFTTPSDWKLYKQVLKRNFQSIYYFDFRRQTGFIFLLIFFAFLFFGNRKKIFTDDYFFSLLFAVIFIYGGYALILVHVRYIWVCTLLMLLLTAWLMEESKIKFKSQPLVINVFFIFFIVGFSIKRPIKEILFTEDREMKLSVLLNAMLHPAGTMRATYIDHRYLAKARRESGTVIQPESSLASIKNSAGNTDGYTQASLIALASKSRYLGQVSSGDSIESDLLSNMKIDYLILFSPDQSIDSTRWNEVYSNENIFLKIFDRK